MSQEYSKQCQISKMIRQFENLGILRDIKAYWGILDHIQIYSKLCVTLAYTTQSIFKTVKYGKYQAYLELWHSQKQCLNFIQAISRIFRDIQEYWCRFSHTNRHQTRGKWGMSVLPFFDNRKSALIWEEKALIVSVFGLNFPFKM